MNLIEYLQAVTAITAARVFTEYPRTVPAGIFAVVTEDAESQFLSMFDRRSVTQKTVQVNLYDPPDSSGNAPARARLVDVYNTVFYADRSVDADSTPGLLVKNGFTRQLGIPPEVDSRTRSQSAVVRFTALLNRT